MTVPDEADATKILDDSSTEGEYYSFKKSDTGIIFIKNGSNSAGDAVEIYGSFGEHSTDFFIGEWTNSDVGGDNATLADSLSPVPAFLKAKPTTGSWTVYCDGDW